MTTAYVVPCLKECPYKLSVWVQRDGNGQGLSLRGWILPHLSNWYCIMFIGQCIVCRLPFIIGPYILFGGNRVPIRYRFWSYVIFIVQYSVIVQGGKG